MDTHVHLIGNVGNEVDYRRATTEMNAWASFRIAQTPRYRRGEEWVDLPTVWLTVNCRRQLAWNVKSSLKTGERVVVSGRLRAHSWTDNKTGEVRDRLVLEADAVGHDLAFGTTNFQRNQHPEGPVVRTGRGGDDPWTSTSGQESGHPTGSGSNGSGSDGVGSDGAGSNGGGPQDAPEGDRPDAEVHELEPAT